MLKVESLVAGYGMARVLHGLNLEINNGEVVCLLGSNGAGKSTTIKTINGLLHLWEGTIKFENEVISGQEPYEIVRKGIATVPEGRRIFAELTVEENLLVGDYIERNKHRAVERLKLVCDFLPQLTKKLGQKGGTLSGGEQQMLAVGRGLMSRPKCLLLDELSMGISPLLVKEIFLIIRKLNREEGITIFLVEQNAKMALAVAGRGYVLENGQIVVEGTPQALMRNEMVIEAYLGVV